jgi:hypothetical protein
VTLVVSCVTAKARAATAVGSSVAAGVALLVNECADGGALDALPFGLFDGRIGEKD